MFRTLRLISRAYFSQKNNLYQIMGLSQNASQEDIKKRFHELAKKYHPDSQQSQTGTDELFKEVSQAYSILSDLNQRSLYDQQNIKQQTKNYQYKKDNTQNYDSQDYHQDTTTNPRGGFQQYNKHKQMNQGGDGVEEGFLNSMRRAPELYLLSFIMAAITIRWWQNLYEAQRASKQISYPEDPEFVAEREHEMAKRQHSPQKIFVQPNECRQIPKEVLDQMYESGRYNLPQQCLDRLDKHRNQIGQQIEFDNPQHVEDQANPDRFENQRQELIRSALVFKQQHRDLNYISKANQNEL